MPDSYKSTEDPQAMTLHAGNGTFQQAEQDGAVKSDGADDSTNNSQTWQVFSHEISVKTGFPGSESWPQENGHNGKLSFDSLELEKVTIILPVEEDQALSQPATCDLEILSQDNGHNPEVSFDALELEEETLKLPVLKGQALSQPATYDLTVVIP